MDIVTAYKSCTLHSAVNGASNSCSCLRLCARKPVFFCGSHSHPLIRTCSENGNAMSLRVISFLRAVAKGDIVICFQPVQRMRLRKTHFELQEKTLFCFLGSSCGSLSAQKSSGFRSCCYTSQGCIGTSLHDDPKGLTPGNTTDVTVSVYLRVKCLSSHWREQTCKADGLILK